MDFWAKRNCRAVRVYGFATSGYRSKGAFQNSTRTHLPDSGLLISVGGLAAVSTENQTPKHRPQARQHVRPTDPYLNPEEPTFFGFLIMISLCKS